MPLVNTPNLTIEYEAAGQGSTALVFVHGNLASWRWWQPVLRGLPPGFRAYAPIMRGCGQSKATEAGYEIPTLAQDLDTFVEQVGLSSFHLVAHSLGGAIAIQYALEHATKVKSLTLVSPAPPGGLAAMCEGETRPAQMLRCLDSDLLPASALKSLYQTGQLVGTNRIMIREALKEMMSSAQLDEEMSKALFDDALHQSPSAVMGYFDALRRWDVRLKLKDIHTPTTIYWGAKDTIIPKASMDEAIEHLPNARLVVLPEVGHSPQLEQPELFRDLLVAFVSRQSVPTYVRWLYWRIRDLAVEWIYANLPPRRVPALKA